MRQDSAILNMCELSLLSYLSVIDPVAQEICCSFSVSVEEYKKSQLDVIFRSIGSCGDVKYRKVR